MHAADLVATHSIREAAVLGGIVRCIIATDRCEAGYIGSYVYDIIAAFNLVGVDCSKPCPAEIGMVLERFEEVYGRPLQD